MLGLTKLRMHASYVCTRDTVSPLYNESFRNTHVLTEGTAIFKFPILESTIPNFLLSTHEVIINTAQAPHPLETTPRESSGEARRAARFRPPRWSPDERGGGGGVGRGREEVPP